MNIKRIVKYLELKSQLTTEELQMAETMVGLTESDKEALAGLLQPVRASKPATRRVIEHCVADVNGTACTLTRRARVHKDSSVKDYHEFQPQAQLLDKKSARASSIASAIKGGKAEGLRAATSLCAKEGCGLNESSGIHDKSMGYEDYHPFVSSSAVRSVVGQSSMNDSEVSSETGSGAVSSAAGD